jgi:hypothetical protein
MEVMFPFLCAPYSVHAARGMIGLDTSLLRGMHQSTPWIA